MHLKHTWNVCSCGELTAGKRNRLTKGIEKRIFFKMNKKYYELECGPMPNVMIALSNIGGALCSTPQSLADAHY